jgi:hypothetical protein
MVIAGAKLQSSAGKNDNRKDTITNGAINAASLYFPWADVLVAYRLLHHYVAAARRNLTAVRLKALPRM